MWCWSLVSQRKIVFTPKVLCSSLKHRSTCLDTNGNPLSWLCPSHTLPGLWPSSFLRHGNSWSKVESRCHTAHWRQRRQRELDRGELGNLADTAIFFFFFFVIQKTCSWHFTFKLFFSYVLPSAKGRKLQTGETPNERLKNKPLGLR